LQAFVSTKFLSSPIALPPAFCAAFFADFLAPALRRVHVMLRPPCLARILQLKNSRSQCSRAAALRIQSSGGAVSKASGSQTATLENFRAMRWKFSAVDSAKDPRQASGTTCCCGESCIFLFCRIRVSIPVARYRRLPVAIFSPFLFYPPYPPAFPPVLRLSPPRLFSDRAEGICLSARLPVPRPYPYAL